MALAGKHGEDGAPQPFTGPARLRHLVQTRQRARHRIGPRRVRTRQRPATARQREAITAHSVSVSPAARRQTFTEPACSSNSNSQKRRAVRATIPAPPNPVRLKSVKCMSTLGGRVLRFFKTHLAGDRSEVRLFSHTSPQTNEMFHHRYPVVIREFGFLNFVRGRG